MTTKKRMAGMKLGQFGGLSKPELEPEPVPRQKAAKSKPKATIEPVDERLTTVNIKIRRDQQRWLQDTAQQVRDNNDVPTSPEERVYPQHLIQAAIDLLKTSDVDWQQVRNADDLKRALEL